MHRLAIAVATIGLGFSQLAGAATTFDFTNYGSADDTASLDVLSADGLVTANLTAPDGNLGATDLSGIGAKSPGALAGPLQNNELLRVDFDTLVNIDSITLAQWEGTDDLLLTTSAGGDAISLSGDTCSLCSEETFSVNLTGIDYLIIEGDSLATATYLAGLGGVTIVPVPAAVWLFGSALGMLRLTRRRT